MTLNIMGKLLNVERFLFLLVKDNNIFFIANNTCL